MRKLLTFLLLLAFSTTFTTSIAATKNKTIPLRTLSATASIEVTSSEQDQISALAVSNSQIYVVGTVIGKASSAITSESLGGSDGFIIALDLTGTVQWSARLGTALDDIATSVAVDSRGDIWVLGASVTAKVDSPTPTPSLDATDLLNPDNVESQIPNLLPDGFKTLNLWNISASGEVKNTFSKVLATAIDPQAITVERDVISAVGISFSDKGTQGFLAVASSTDGFQSVKRFGNTSTIFSQLVRESDGGYVVVGESGETLGKEKAKSVRDAVTLKFDANGVVKSVGRASLKNAARSWSSIARVGTTSGSTWQGGDALYANRKYEAAVTRYSKIGTPVWSQRYLATSPALVANADSKRFLSLFSTKTSPSGTSGFASTAIRPVLLSFDAKGTLAEGRILSGNPLSLIWLKERGALAVCENHGSLYFFFFHPAGV